MIVTGDDKQDGCVVIVGRYIVPTKNDEADLKELYREPPWASSD